MLAVAHAGVWWVGPQAMKKAKAMKKQARPLAMKKVKAKAMKKVKVKAKAMKKVKVKAKAKGGSKDNELLYPPFSCFVRELYNNYWSVFHPLMHPQNPESSADLPSNAFFHPLIISRD